MTVSDPRPQRRIADRQAGIAKVLAEGECRACGQRNFLSRAHLVAKGQRGDDVEANIVPLCGDGTRGCHGSLTDHHPAGWPSRLVGKDWRFVASVLRGKLREDELEYVLAKKGADWLDRVYPKGDRRAYDKG